MPKSFYTNKSRIPKWYRKRIKNFDTLSDVQALYEYTYLKLAERVRKLSKKIGKHIQMPRKLEQKDITPYDIAYLESIQVKELPVFEGDEAEFYIDKLITFTDELTTALSQEWRDLAEKPTKTYSSKRYAKLLSFASNIRAAGDLIINTLNDIKQTAQQRQSVYEYFLKGNKYRSLQREIETAIRHYSTQLGDFSAVSAITNALLTGPMAIQDSIRSDDLSDIDSEEEEDFY